MITHRVGAQLHIQCFRSPADLHTSLSRVSGVEIGGFAEKQGLATRNDGVGACKNTFGTRIQNVSGGEVRAHCRESVSLPAPLIISTNGQVRSQLDLPGKLLDGSDKLLERCIGYREQLDDVYRRLAGGDTVVAKEKAFAIQHCMLTEARADRHVGNVGLAEDESIQQLCFAPM
ncbi:hypothetical protein D3C81_1615870 [compost metagenome]